MWNPWWRHGRRNQGRIAAAIKRHERFEAGGK
jgi:hypothetical protein